MIQIFRDEDDYLNSSNDMYDFLKINYSNSWQLMFQQYIYENRLEFQEYLKFFLRKKQNEPLEALGDYIQGRQDLAIQTIELEDWDKQFLTDKELYEFLSTSFYAQSEIVEGQELLKFINTKIEFLNLTFNDKVLATDQTHFSEFQNQIDIFASEL